MSNLVSKEWLRERLNDDHVVVVDCRFVLGNPDAGRQAYGEGHIPGAVHFDLEKDLSGPVREHGGRHPLPDLGTLALKLGEAGIDDTVQVVAYDDQGGAMASRFWWLLKFMGHAQVSILDEGFSSWKEAGYPVTQEAPSRSPRSFVPQVQTPMLVSMEDVRNRLGQTDTVLIDSRDERRYLGLEEPLDRVAGHIPGARNFFWKAALDDAGRWKQGDDQRERFADLPAEGEIIVYCGSGVTACPNILALTEAGFSQVKLYSGSWSDWISYEGNPVAMGEEGKA
ncbi:sulfurtransferase [Paenibacillus sp. J2TS4]|uniref:sulfurtransferase n=1 Tax=Paenibacillus sp. J2TS4 TaxID=2807194 RepID=UPI001B06EE50|nr:sulfurtransferase [Paenibacillus sp. J2TS4]GIP35670.1 thiosulfate sulfurtransferase [Paenibacillus sp. J2TS4]